MNALHKYYNLYVDSLHTRGVFDVQEVAELKDIFDRELSGIEIIESIEILEKMRDRKWRNSCYFCIYRFCDGCPVTDFCFTLLNFSPRTDNNYALMETVLDEYTD